LSALAALPREAFAKDTGVPHATEITVRGAAKPFSGDRSMFVTIAPESAGRDTARVLFRLGRRARVRLDAVRTGIGTSSVRWTKEATLGPGPERRLLRPADAARPDPRSYGIEPDACAAAEPEQDPRRVAAGALGGDRDEHRPVARKRLRRAADGDLGRMRDASVLRERLARERRERRQGAGRDPE
jgi:hypothetical protein